MITKIAIVGGGGFGKEVYTLIKALNQKKQQFDIRGFYDDEQKDDLPPPGWVNYINQLPHDKNMAVALALGNPKIKKHVASRFSNSNCIFPYLIHPEVTVGDRNSLDLGKGVIINSHSSITLDVALGDFVMINLNCTIGHDVSIGAFSSLQPGANISGNVKIGEGVLIGTGANVINDVTIGDGATIGAGATVISNIPAGATAVGVPARVVK